MSLKRLQLQVDIRQVVVLIAKTWHRSSYVITDESDDSGVDVSLHNYSVNRGGAGISKVVRPLQLKDHSCM